MANAEVESLIEAQLKRYSSIVNDMARRVGVNYCRWPQVSEAMSIFEIDGIELADFLAVAFVTQFSKVLGADRYEMESSDGSRIASVTVSVWQEIMTIEIINMKTKEA